ncbi:hypothetical protein LBMAG27_23820 [Bacteroidota bacterium]|nr:hypothetical protein LBMAG27_23820 [Bacteroidota bacterium]
MKKFSTLLIALISSAIFSNAQSFTDDFESYTAGNLLAQSSTTWATWAGAGGGGADDAPVSNALAHSGSNSLFLSSTLTAGGPDDIVLPFGSVFSNGSFVFECWINVQTGKGAYFNYQASTTLGQIWSMDVTYETNGDLKFENSGTLMLQTTYPQGQWFDFKMTSNLNNSSWDISIDGNNVGSFQNPVFNVAAIDFYPILNSSFYIDDVSFTHTPYSLPNLNAAVMNLSIQNGLATQNRFPSVTVRNLGVSAINSFDLTANYNGTSFTQNFTSLNYASNSVHVITLNQSLALASGNIPANVIVSNINGSVNDDDITDDTAFTTVTAVTPATGKVVVGEEATGTWCQWCPRGAVFMDMMTQKYDDYYAGIAIHNSDPMTDSAYDASMGAYISGYPSAVVDRGATIDPSAIEQDFQTRILVAPKVFITNGAIYNSSTRELKVSIKSVWQAAVTGTKYKLVCVLTEDSLHSTASGWSQSNAYAGGGSGVMGGFELLSNPVPAAQMNYNHVARFIYPNWDGAAAYAASINANDIVIDNFTFILPAGWDESQIHIIGMVIYNDGSNHYIDNAGTATIAQAVANGYLTGTDLGGLGTINGITFFDPSQEILLYPNPAADESFVKLNLQSAAEVVLSVYNVTGCLMQTKNYGILTAGNILPIETSLLSQGIYVIEISLNGKKQILKLVKE